MPETSESRSDREKRVDDAIAEFFEARENDRPLDRHIFLARYPDLADDLSSFLADQASFPMAAEVAVPSFDETATLPPLSPALAPTLSPSDASDDMAAPLRGKISHFGDYELLEEIGRGGMGVVYKARQIKANRVVALKMILSGAHASQRDLERFRIEGQSVARLQHPNIVQVFDVGEHDGKPYFALEFCGGGNLARKLAGTPLPSREAAILLEQLARAIAEAHAKGIIHRDLKPANVMLTAGGEPKVTDFGLAKQLDASSPGSEAGELTQTGAVMGTPSYMAPEQAAGDTKHIGPACDVYALGAILYECLTGRPPFKAATALDTILQVVGNEPVSPRRLNPQVSAANLETICLKCLSKETARRYKSALGLADDLRRYLDGRPVLARPVGRAAMAIKWVRRNPIVFALLALVTMALGGGAWGMLWQYGKVRVERDHAREQERLAGLARDEARFQQYKSETMLHSGRLDQARAELTVGNHEKAREILFQCDASFRGWEWDHLFGRLPHRAARPQSDDWSLRKGAGTRIRSDRDSVDGQGYGADVCDPRRTGCRQPGFGGAESGRFPCGGHAVASQGPEGISNVEQFGSLGCGFGESNRRADGPWGRGEVHRVRSSSVIAAVTSRPAASATR